MMPGQPVCSVIIPSYNNSFYTRLCLEALGRSRAAEPEYELIVVDNASHDDTASVLASFEADITRLVFNDTNRGFAAGCNQGADLAQGQFLVFLNNDIVVEPGWLRALVDEACDETVGAVGARLLHHDGTIQHAGIAFGTGLSPVHSFYGYPGNWPEALVPRDYQAVTGACLLVDARLFRELGGFDTTFLNSFEDVDLCLKIRVSGRRVRYCPTSVCHHFESPTPDRFLRDDRNLRLFRKRWAKHPIVAIDFDPAEQPLQRVISQAVLLRDELEGIARRAGQLATMNYHLLRLLAQEGRSACHSAGSAGELVSRQRLRYDLVYEPAPIVNPVAGTETLVPVVVFNRGTAAWPPRDLRLSYHWREAASGTCLLWEGPRTVFEQSLGPGQVLAVMAKVRLPEQPGTYVLEWDAVEEGIAWMSGRGVEPCRQAVTVTRASQVFATVEGLPVRMRSGETVEVRVELDTSEEDLTAPLAWQWTTLDGHTPMGAPIAFPENGQTARNHKMALTVTAPDRQGIFRLQVYYRHQQGQDEQREEWCRIDTYGGLARVFVDPIIEERDVVTQLLVPGEDDAWVNQRTGNHAARLAGRLARNFRFLRLDAIFEPLRRNVAHRYWSVPHAQAKVLIVAHEAVGSKMTGPAIRCLELAKVISERFDVTLAVPEPSDIPIPGFRLACYSRGKPELLYRLARESDAILISGFLLNDFPLLAEMRRVLVVDLYDPFPVENLHLHRDRNLETKSKIIANDFRVLGDLQRVGDFFICASERQRDFWLGMLAAAGRVNPANHADDPSFRKLVDVVPMGIPNKPPSSAQSVKDVVDGIGPDDFVVVWPGGVWDWLDPLTALEAVHLLSSEAPDVKLVFPGILHPHPERVGNMDTPKELLRRAERLGLLGRNVFCFDWTPYEERARFLSGADLALSLHFETLETHLAFRTRLLDCLWSGLPVVTTRGDVLAERLADAGLATLVAPGDAWAVARAILRWRGKRRDKLRLAAQFDRVAADYRWAVVAQPLLRFLQQVRPAADRCNGRSPRGDDHNSQRAWPSAALGLPFDHFERHQLVAHVLKAAAHGDRLRVLDVGGHNGSLGDFLSADDSVVVLDRQPDDPLRSVVGDAGALPFGDAAFDFVVSLDTMEHVPAHLRLRMLDEALRVAKKAVVLVAPFASSEVLAAECTLFDFIKNVLGIEHEQLREHLANTLPDRSQIEAHLGQTGYPYQILPGGSLRQWLAMMLLKHYVLSLPDSAALHEQIDRYYNEWCSAADGDDASYRLLFLVCKADGNVVISRVREMLRLRQSAKQQSASLSHLGNLGSLLSWLAGESHAAATEGSPQDSGQLPGQEAYDQLLARAWADLRERDETLAAVWRDRDALKRRRVVRLADKVGRLLRASRLVNE